MNRDNISLKYLLFDEQNYIYEIIKKYGIECRMVIVDSPTYTCHDQAKAIGFEPKRVIKTIYMSYKSMIFCFICPEFGTKNDPKYISKKAILKRHLNFSNRKARRVDMGFIPAGMIFGTCSPFLPKKYLKDFGKKTLYRVFFQECFELENEIVDIAIGGTTNLSLRSSIQLRYKDLSFILKKIYKNRLVRKNLFV